MIARLFAPVAMKVAAGFQILSLGFILFLLLARAGEARRADKWQLRATETQVAFDKTIADYRRARAEQKATDAEHARRVEQGQAAISRETSSDYQDALADLRRRYDALRLQAGKGAADSGSGGGADLPGLPGAAGWPDGAAAPGENDFNCAANSIQLESLQQWVRGQVAIIR